MSYFDVNLSIPEGDFSIWSPYFPNAIDTGMNIPFNATDAVLSTSVFKLQI